MNGIGRLTCPMFCTSVFVRNTITLKGILAGDIAQLVADGAAQPELEAAMFLRAVEKIREYGANERAKGYVDGRGI